MTDYLVEILSHVRTVDERSEFFLEWDLAKKGVYLSGSRAKEVVGRLSPWISKLAELLKKSEVVEEIEAIKAWPVITITVPALVDESGVQTISDWIRKNVDMKILLNIKRDKSLGMGPTIEYGGKVKDFSVKNKLSQYGI